MLALIFPGQGSQRPGMGAPWQAHPSWAVVGQLSQATGRDIAELLVEAGPETLRATRNAQLATYALSLVALDAARRGPLAAFGPEKLAAAAGHSLGEYSALFAAGVLSAGDTIAAVRERGRLMHREAEKYPGAMVAVIGLTPEKLKGLVHPLTKEGPIALANFNTQEQTVISGSPEMVARAGNLAKAEGARVVPLKVSGAWHSPLMMGANADFAAFMETLNFQTPTLPLYLNATAAPETNPGILRAAMGAQLTSPVRWAELILNLKAAGVDTWVEVGPKNVLKGLVRKILPQDPPESFHNVENRESLEKFLNAI